MPLKPFLVLLTLWVCAITHAQLAPPPTVLHSAESLAIEADRIVVGHVESVRQQGADQMVRLSVQETIKGEPLPKLELPAVWGLEPIPNPGRLLIHTVSQGPNPAGGAPTPPRVLSIIDLSQPDVTLYSADFALLRGPAAILRRVRELASKAPVADRFTDMAPPPELQTRLGYMRLRVPVDARFEAQLRARLRSERIEERSYALQSLPAAVVPGLVDDVKRLLNDPYRVEMGAAEANMGFDLFAYPLRDQAWLRLKEWGVDVPRPQVEERVSRLATVQVVKIMSFNFSRADLLRLREAPKLDELILQGPSLALVDLEAIAAIRSLRILRIRSVRFENAGLASLARLPNLELIQFVGSTLDDDGLRRLEDLKSLRMLDIGDSNVTRGAVVRFLQMRPDVRLVPRRRHNPPQPISGNPLHHAAIRNDAVLVRELVTRENVNSTDSDSRTALHYAAAANAAQVIPVLLEAGADVNVRSSVGVTPLHWALEFDSVDAVKLLIAAKPNLNILRTDGGSVTLPDGRVARRGYTPLAGTLLDGLDSISSMLIEEGSDVNATDEAGWTPLMVAVTSNRPPAMLELLIRRGARVAHKNLSGQSALDIARAMGNEAAVRFLTDHGG